MENEKKTTVLRRELITDLGRYYFPDELLTENQAAANLKYYLDNMEYMVVFNKPNNIEITKTDENGNLYIVNFDTISE